MRYLNRRELIIQGSLLMSASAFAQALPDGPAVNVKTATYSSPGGKDLSMDLFLPPSNGKKLPVIIFLHGGGWFGGNRKTGPDFRRFFAKDGFAMASIDYRLTTTVTFPTPVEDVKAAVRFLRANAVKYGLDPERIGIWGTSAGSQLGMVAALSPKGMFEGEGNLDKSSSVRCVLDAYGPTNFALMDKQTAEEHAGLQPLAEGLKNAPMIGPGGPGGRPGGGPPGGFPGGGGPPGGFAPGGFPGGPPAGANADPTAPGARGPGNAGAPGGGIGPHDAPTSPESRLIGAPIQSAPGKVKAASPLTYVSHDAPPFLIMHGLADDSVPHTQSVMMYEALVKADCDVALRLIDGLPHTFFNRTNLDELAGPFRMDVREHIKGKPETWREDRANAFDVARAFFQKQLG